MIILEIFLIICMTISIFYYIFSLYSTISFFNKKVGKVGNYQPPVSILKPINGIENGIHENFISYCNQDYPDYQIVFGVSDSNDPVINVVRDIMKKFPQRDIELVISNDKIGTNPKINNLNNMYIKAKHDILVTNDSDTKVSEDYLKKVVSPLGNKDIGLVTCVYRENIINHAASIMESISINQDFFTSVMVAQQVEDLSYAFGVTIATRRYVLDMIGGFKELTEYLAEDYHLGKKIFDAGYKLCLSDYIVDVVPAKRNIFDFLMLQLRWAKTIRVCRPTGYFFASFCKYGIIPSLAYLFISGFSPLGVILLIAFLSVRIISASIISLKYLKDQNLHLHILFLLLTDILNFIIWCASYSGNKITWRGGKFILKKGGLIVKI